MFTITLERSDRLTSNCAQGKNIVFFRSSSNMGYIGPQFLVPPHVIKFTLLQINFCKFAYSTNLLLSLYHSKMDCDTLPLLVFPTYENMLLLCSKLYYPRNGAWQPRSEWAGKSGIGNVECNHLKFGVHSCFVCSFG